MNTPALLDLLRQDLRDYTVDSVQSLLGPVAHAALAREQPVPARRVSHARLPDPVATLVHVFLLGEPVRSSALRAALPRLGVGGAEQLGLVSVAGQGRDDQVRARVDLRPYAALDAAGELNWWLLSDPAELATGATLAPDHVLGVGGASVTLARSTVRRRVRRTLDLGTGCGIQALHAARHSQLVVGTDVSARALQMARMNWHLNRETLGDCVFQPKQGSLLEPVADQQFDLVVSNPPFVITPRSPEIPTYEYRDAGLLADDVVHRLVAQLGQVLAPGGIAQLLGNWEVRAGEEWHERPQSWLARCLQGAAAVDAWVSLRELQDPAEYAETWIRDAGQQRTGSVDALYEAWLADFASRRVQAIGFGLITLRRPAGPGGAPLLRRWEDRRAAPGLPAGDEVLAALQAHDWLAGKDDQALLSAALRVAADVTEERHHRPGEADPTVILLRQGGAAARCVRAGTALAGLVGACAGDLPLGQLIGALAELLDSSQEHLCAELLPQVRELVADGMLEF